MHTCNHCHKPIKRGRVIVTVPPVITGEPVLYHHPRCFWRVEYNKALRLLADNNGKYTKQQSAIARSMADKELSYVQ